VIVTPQLRVNDANGPNQNGGDLDDDFYNWLPPPQEAWHLIPHYTCTAAVLETTDPNTSYLFTAYNDKSWRDYTDPNDPAFSTEFTIGYGASQNLTCGTGWTHDLARSKDGYAGAGSMPPPRPDARWLQEQTDVKSAVGGNGYIYAVGVNNGIGNHNDAIFLARSRDGITWDPNDVFTVVADNDELIEYRTPFVAAGGPRGYADHVYVVWIQDRRIVGGQYNDGRARTILFVESRDGGASFSYPPEIISPDYIEADSSQFLSTLPVCAAAVGPRPSGEVYVTWYARPQGTAVRDIFPACEVLPVPVAPDTFEIRRFEPKVPGQPGEGTWYPDPSASQSSTVITEFLPLWRSSFSPDFNNEVSNFREFYEQPAIAVDQHKFREGWVYFVYATEDPLYVSDPNSVWPCVGDVNIRFARLRPGISGAWEEKEAAGPTPSPRYEHIFVNDRLRANIVMHGGSTYRYGPGTSETKLWNGFFWEDGASGGPFARASHAAYDARRDRVVAFGGRDPFNNNRPSDATYEYTGSAWVLMQPPTSPTARENHAMAYDATNPNPSQRVVLLFGGRSGDVAPYTYNADTWAWDGTEWTLRASTGPPARWKHAMAYDRQRNRVLLFGGENAAGQALPDTWEWDATSWTQVQTPGPSARADHAMAYDDTWKRMVLFGGRTQSGEVKGDTWFWMLDEGAYVWKQHQLSQGEQVPSPRYGHAMAFSGRVGVVLFGGLDDTDPNQPVLYNDVWEWQTSRWEVFASPLNDPQPEPLPPSPWHGIGQQWRFGATSQFMPAMAMTRAGHLGVSWLDRRDDDYADPNDPLMNQAYRCYFAWSADGGETWQGGSPGTPDLDVSLVSVDPRADTQNPLVYEWLDRLVSLGGYRGMGAWGRKFLPVWVDLTDWPQYALRHDPWFAYHPPLPPEPEIIQQLGDIYGALVEVIEPVPPDYEPDCDVDLADFTVFQLCFGGSNNPPAPACPPGMDADYDNDGDVDLQDFDMFFLAFTGAGVNPCDDDGCPTGGEEEGESGMAPTFVPEPVPDELYWQLYEYCLRNGIPFT